MAPKGSGNKTVEKLLRGRHELKQELPNIRPVLIFPFLA